MKSFIEKLSMRDLALAITGGGLGISFASILYDKSLFNFHYPQGVVMLLISGVLCLAGRCCKRPTLLICGLALLCLTAAFFTLLMLDALA